MLKVLALASLLLTTSVAFAAGDEITGMNVEVQSAATPQNSGYSVSETASEFLFLPARGDNSAQFAFSRVSAPFAATVTDQNGNSSRAVRASANTNDYDFQFARNISSATYLTFDLGYQTASTSIDGVEASSAGLKDFGLGLTGINHNNGWNLVYGANFTVSPALSVGASDVTDGNRFSGGSTATGFIGFEALSHSAIWGMKAFATAGSGQAEQVTGFDQRVAMADVFYEVPLFPTARVGFVAGAGHNLENSAAYTGLSMLNAFTGAAYSKISFPRQADLILKVQANSLSYENEARNTTDASIALRKTL